MSTHSDGTIPVAEAIIDFRVTLPTGVEAADLSRCQADIQEAYPHSNALRDEKSQPAGYLFTSADQRFAFQARLTDFLLHGLRPYAGWQAFRDEARRLWNIYRQVARATQVTRVAVRYINQINLPGPVAALKDYLNYFPEVPAELPQPADDFFMRIMVFLPDVKGTMILTATTPGPRARNMVSILLDTDLFREEALPASEDELWAFCETLHDWKNKVVEACVTERTKELLRQ